MRGKSLLAIGYPSLDYMIKVSDSVTFGQTTLIENDDNQCPNYGGCGVNIAYLVAQFSHKTGVAMRVGNDFQKTGYEKFLKDGQVNLEEVQQIKSVPTSSTRLIMNEAGDHITLFYPGAMESKFHQATSFDHLSEFDYGVVTVCEPQYGQGFVNQCIKEKHPLIFSMKADFTSMPVAYIDQVMQHSELIFMNEVEYSLLNDKLPQPVKAYLNNPITQGIIVTQGGQGSYIYTKQEEIIIPAVKQVAVVDTAGGGDAYIAGFLHGYFSGKDLSVCGEYGSVLSAFIIEKMGCLSNVPTLEQFTERHQKNYN